MVQAVVESVHNPSVAPPVSNDARAALPPRDPVIVGLAAGVAAKNPMPVPLIWIRVVPFDCSEHETPLA